MCLWGNMDKDDKTNFGEVFSKIYEKHAWGNGSGPGSAQENTKSYRTVLQYFFNQSHINTIVDLGCGDWQIMSLLTIPYNKKYIGLDVVQSLIDAHQQKHLKSNVSFKLIQGLEDVPFGDLLIVKDVAQHWPNVQIDEFIETVLPKFKYALITNCFQACAQWPGFQEIYNQDIQLGGYRPIDLTDAPFNLKNAELYIKYAGGGDKRTYLWTNPNNTGSS